MQDEFKIDTKKWNVTTVTNCISGFKKWRIRIVRFMPKGADRHS